MNQEPALPRSGHNPAIRQAAPIRCQPTTCHRFRLAVPESVLADLRERLSRTRCPDEPPLEPWSTGTSVAYLKALVDYWRDGFDWRAQEARLNAFRQFTVPLGGHRPALHPRAGPRAPAHAAAALARLAGLGVRVPQDPPDADRSGALRRRSGGCLHRGRAVAARLRASRSRRASRASASSEIADVFAELMTDVLGYQRFAAQGGDWGGFVTSRLGYAYPERLIGIHLNLLAVRRDPKMLAEPTPGGEAVSSRSSAHWLKEETGYQWIQGTKPQTLAFGLTDSPVGLAAWIVEKFRTWSDCDGDLENALTRDEMLTNIMLYWVTGAIGSSFWPYYARMHGPWPIPDGKTRRRADRLRRVPEGDPAAAALGGGAHVHRHPALDGDAEGRTLRGAGAAGGAGAGGAGVLPAAASGLRKRDQSLCCRSRGSGNAPQLHDQLALPAERQLGHSLTFPRARVGWDGAWSD